MSKATAGWERVGDRFYRKVQLYTSIFDPDLELENYLISGAPYSGALALHRNEDKIQAFRGNQVIKSSIDIYSCSGKLIRRINWDKGPIKGLGWSEDEKLLVVSQDGTVRIFSGLSDDFTPFTLGSDAEEHGVVSCRFWLTGFVALLGNNQLVSVPQYDEPRPKILATPPSDEITSWTVVPPTYTLSRSVEVLLAIGQTIYVVDATEVEDRQLQNGPFRHICISPNGRFIALYTEDSKVWVISSDFQDKLSEYNSRAKTVPKDMQWCGNDSVVLAWEDELHMVGPDGVALKNYYDAWVHIVPDVDGVRLFTNDLCEFLHKVPDASEDTFKLGSLHPAAVLIDAADLLEKRSPKADDNIQLIKNSLASAVDTCIAAAGYEYDIHWQKELLRAASFGKTVTVNYNSDEFVTMCETLRILNAVRFYEVGLPLSYDQFIRLTPERLIQRLITRQEYSLALRIAGYLRLPDSSIYIHWASQKVKNATADDEATCAAIVARVAKATNPGRVSFAAIANIAHDEGRHKLATLLLDHEVHAAAQVPLLLSMSEDTLALDKALASGDSDLILSVLLHLRQALPLASFFRTLTTRPTATALVEQTARHADRALLKDLYYQDDRRRDGSNLLFADALAAPDTQSKLDKLRLAARVLQDSKESSFQARALDETQRLLRFQDALDADAALRPRNAAPAASPVAAATPPKFSGQPLTTTLHMLYTLSTPAGAKRAAALVSEFKVGEKTHWWVRLRAQVAARAWREIEEVARAHKKSPIGWEAFYRETLGAGNAVLAGSFVARCTGLTWKERVEMWVKCGLFVGAGKEAVKAKDLAVLEELRGRVDGRDALEIERMIGGLKKGR